MCRFATAVDDRLQSLIAIQPYREDVFVPSSRRIMNMDTGRNINIVVVTEVTVHTDTLRGMVLCGALDFVPSDTTFRLVIIVHITRNVVR